MVSFPSALCNSAARGIAYPSLFTGLSPDRAREQFHTNPLIWAHAKARGYSTSLHTSQSLRWCNLDQLLLDDTLDRVVYRETLNAPAFNDLAMDDGWLNRIAMEDIVAMETPFFSVVNYNMLQFPYSNGEAKTATNSEESLDHYRNALRKFDKCLGDLLDALETSGKLKNTVIFFTASHGESTERTDFVNERPMPLRLNDFDTDVLRVPFWIRLPEGAISTRREAQLRANSGAIVSNIDIYPSVMDLLGYNFEKRKEWCSGQSLFGSINQERSVIALNTGELRGWKYEPFALAREGCLLLFHDDTLRTELIRLDDPQENDIWESMPDSEQSTWFAAIEKKPAHRAIFMRRLSSPASVKMRYNASALDNTEAELFKRACWGFTSLEDWDEMCRKTAAFIGIEKGDYVFESGCGTGAFLKVLRDNWDTRVAGVDIADKAVEIARQNISGEFWVGDIQDLSFIPSGTYDKVVSMGVFLYLPTLEALTCAALEMIRIAKPGGVIHIGVLNDPQRMEGFRGENPPSGNAFAGREFWTEFARRQSLSIKIVDQNAIYTKPDRYDAFSQYRYSIRMEKTDALPALGG